MSGGAACDRARSGRPGHSQRAAGRAVGPELTPLESQLLADLFAIVSEHADDSAVEIDRDRVTDAFVFACEHHADQRRMSGEEFIVHPVGVARICAGMRLDTETICAALLHDTVEDTSASLEEVCARFGDEVGSARRRGHEADRDHVLLARRGRRPRTTGR